MIFVHIKSVAKIAKSKNSNTKSKGKSSLKNLIFSANLKLKTKSRNGTKGKRIHSFLFHSEGNVQRRRADQDVLEPQRGIQDRQQQRARLNHNHIAV